MSIWVSSDYHFNHDREFIWKERGFSSVQEMNEEIIKRHNSVVKSGDEVYLLGDICLGGSENLENNKKLIEQLNGNIHIVLGNHDTASRKQMYEELPNIDEIAPVGIRFKWGKYNFILTHYPMITGNLEAESLRQMALNLYGHTHQNTNFYKDMPYCYHVGVDSHNCYPVNLDTIINEMYAKVDECLNQL